MTVLALVAVVVLVFLNGFFVAAEFALVRVRRSRIEEMAQEERRGKASLVLVLLDDLSVLTGSDDVDLLVLDGAPPTARFAGLVGAQPLYEESPGLFARTQMAAALEFYETAWLRDLDLQRMASS